MNYSIDSLCEGYGYAEKHPCVGLGKIARYADNGIPCHLYLIFMYCNEDGLAFLVGVFAA